MPRSLDQPVARIGLPSVVRRPIISHNPALITQLVIRVHLALPRDRLARPLCGAAEFAECCDRHTRRRRSASRHLRGAVRRTLHALTIDESASAQHTIHTNKIYTHREHGLKPGPPATQTHNHRHTLTLTPSAQAFPSTPTTWSPTLPPCTHQLSTQYATV